MNPIAGWGLAIVAVAVGWFSYGWQGLVLAATVVVFWLVLQFNRVLRVMRRAGGRPVGTTPSAVMLHSRLHFGMTLLQVLPLAGALGEKVDDDPETFVWADAGGDRVRVELRRGRVAAFTLQRAAPDVPAAGDPAAPAP